MNRSDQAPGVYLISPSSAVPEHDVRVRCGIENLAKAGFDARLDRAALARHQRFAGTDRMRVQAFERAAKAPEAIVMTTRGGYGLGRLLPDLPFERLAAAGKQWVGFSDFTAFHLAMLARAGAVTWAGPALLEDFGSGPYEGLDEVTVENFAETMRGQTEVLGFRVAGPAGIDERGILWGGNLALVCSLIGSPWFPDVSGGILFLEDVNEHPFRIERMLITLLHAGVLDRQKLILLGQFNNYRLTDADHGFDMPAVVRWLRARTKTPVLSGLPFGHQRTKLCLPHGAEVGVATEGRTAFLLMPHAH